MIESQGQNTEISSIRDWVQSGTSDEGWAIHTDENLRYREQVVVPQLIDLRGDSQGVPLLLFCNASRWHEDVPSSSSSILLEWDEETCGRLCSTMSHMSTGKGCASEASRVTSASRSSRVEVGTYHDGFCDSLAIDIAEA